jgi:transcriptional regulator with XRE-family HTH domain
MTAPPTRISAGRARAVEGVSGAALRRLRTTRVRLTQAELAQAVGISRAEVSHLENGKRAPLVHTFDKLCEVLGCDAEELLNPPPVKRAG